MGTDPVDIPHFVRCYWNKRGEAEVEFDGPIPRDLKFVYSVYGLTTGAKFIEWYDGDRLVWAEHAP